MAWRDQLGAKRIARGAEAIPRRAPPAWSTRRGLGATVHAWQAVMCRALDKRSEGVRCYLRIRAMRGAHKCSVDSG